MSLVVSVVTAVFVISFTIVVIGERWQQIIQAIRAILLRIRIAPRGTTIVKTDDYKSVLASNIMLRDEIVIANQTAHALHEQKQLLISVLAERDIRVAKQEEELKQASARIADMAGKLAYADVTKTELSDAIRDALAKSDDRPEESNGRRGVRLESGDTLRLNGEPIGPPEELREEIKFGKPR